MKTKADEASRGFSRQLAMRLAFAAIVFTSCDSSSQSAAQSHPPGENASAIDAPADDDQFTPGKLEDFAGSWEAVSDDGTTYTF